METKKEILSSSGTNANEKVLLAKNTFSEHGNEIEETIINHHINIKSRLFISKNYIGGRYR